MTMTFVAPEADRQLRRTIRNGRKVLAEIAGDFGKKKMFLLSCRTIARAEKVRIGRAGQLRAVGKSRSILPVDFAPRKSPNQS